MKHILEWSRLFRPLSLPFRGSSHRIVHEGVGMVFLTPNVGTRGRVNSIYTKEPCTLEWIDSFGKGEVLVDVGANVGMYTIWAAATKGVAVYAFEPEAQNYAVLNRNIAMNNLQGRVRAYCMGLLDVEGLTTLFLSSQTAGGSCHSVGESLDFKHEAHRADFEQGCISSTLDALVASRAIPVPNHIKIDVDGFEPKVIAGATKTLQHSSVRSLLIEINLNLEDHVALVAQLVHFGFKYDSDQVLRAMRKKGKFKGVAEHVFRR